MKYIILKKGMIVGIILLFICAQSVPIIIGDSINQKHGSKSNNIYQGFKISNTPIKNSPIKINQRITQLIDNIPIPCFLDNIVIADSQQDESYPAMIFNGYDGMIAYENEGNNRIFLRNSQDYGQNWSNQVQLAVFYSPSEPNIEAFSPDISFSPGNNKAYGAYVCPKNNYGVHGFFITREISGDLTETTTYTLDWSFVEFFGFKNSEITTYANSSTPWVIIYIGSTDYEGPQGDGPCRNSTMFCFNDLLEPFYISIVWFPYINHCSNLSITSEYGSSYIYGACELQDSENTRILFFKGNPKIWYFDSEFINFTFSVSNGNLIHPNIFSKDNKIYIAVEKETDDSSEILLFYSKTGGQGWNEYSVTEYILPPDAEPRYPNIYADENTLYCTFIESGNLYLTNSTNEGKTWGEPIQINNQDGTVIEGFQNSKIPDINHFVWTDNRNGNCDIYSSIKFLPVAPNPPDINGKTYGEVGVEYQYFFNSTDDDGDDIEYIVDWGDESPFENIGPVPSGGEVSANHIWNKSGLYNIAVKARDIYNIESDWSYLEVEMPKYRLTKNTPFRNQFSRFSNLFPIIKMLLQRL